MERTKKFTNQEFNSLKRYDCGDLTETFWESGDWLLLKDNQKDKLSNDDYLRLDEHQEELRCIIDDFEKYELPHLKI
jgi:hypothetical protein